MAQEGIATLPMQPMPEESQGIGAFQQEVPDVTERDRFDAVVQAMSAQDPSIAAKLDQILQESNLTPEQVDALAQIIQFLEQNKDNYSAALQSLVQEGAIEEGEFPPQYDEGFMTLLKMVVYAYQTRQQQPEPIPFRKGGLAEAAEALRRQGRGGDTILAHINPEEAALLKRMGGSGSINPNTGLPEFLKFKGVVGAVTGAVKSVASVAKGVVTGVVGAANKVLGPQLTSIVATVGGFMIGGPAGAALAQGLVTYGSGGSLKDSLINAATAYVGGQYGWQAGALAGGVGTLAKGGNLKDALKNAAISAGTSWAMGQMGQMGSEGMAPEGTDLSRAGTIDANGNFVPNTVATPGSVSAVNPTGTGTSVLTPGAVSATTPGGNFGINAGPAPTIGGIAPAGTTAAAGGIPMSANYNFAPDYSLNAAPTAAPMSVAPASAGISAAPSGQMTLGQIGSQIGQGNFGQAISDAGTWMGQNKMLTAGLALGATGAFGGFKPVPAEPLELVDEKTTGETLIQQNPNKYLVGGIPGGTSGSVNYVGTPAGYTPSVATPTYGLGTQQAYPTYRPMAAYTPSSYNFMPRTFAVGGIATTDALQFADPNSPLYSAQNYRSGGTAQYPRRTGQISGPGTETSDDIPAMLSDGEFVVTAKAVRGIGNGSRREGAKKLYRMMHAMEKKAGGSV